jgi:hypothetical protein
VGCPASRDLIGLPSASRYGRRLADEGLGQNEVTSNILGFPQVSHPSPSPPRLEVNKLGKYEHFQGPNTHHRMELVLPFSP